MNLKSFLLLLILSIYGLSFCQIQSNQDKIYTAIDAFVANPTAEKLKRLDQLEVDFYKDKSPKTKDDLLAIVILNCNKAYFENQFGASKKSINSYEKAWQIFQKNKLSDYDITEYCLKPLGNLYTVIGDYDNAENIIKQYHLIALSDKKTDVIYDAVLNLAIVYQQSGRVNLAIDLLIEAINSKQLNNNQNALFWSNLGANYLLQNQIDNAEKATNRAIAIFSKAKDNNRLANCYKNLSNIYIQKSNFDQAKVYFETALKYAALENNFSKKNQAKDFYEYAFLLQKMKNFSESKIYLNKALNNLIVGFENQKSELPSQDKLFADNVLLDVLELKATFFTLENKPKKALEAYQLCNYIQELFENLLISENSKIINQIKFRNRAEKCIAIYLNLYQTEKKSEYLSKAFLESEKTKSGVLKSFLQNKTAFSKQENLLQIKLQNTNNEIVKEQQKINNIDLNKINNLLKEQHQTIVSLKSMRNKLVQNNTNDFDIQKLFKKLDDDNASLIEYFVGQNTIYSFEISNSKTKINTIENSETNKNKIKQFIDYFADSDLISNDISGYNKSGKTLFDLLKISKFKQKKLMIIPDGLLNFVPFEALITEPKATTNFAKMNYLLNDYAIGYNNSACFYLDSKDLKNTNSVLGIFPVFEKSNLELTFSKDEMQAIKQNFEGNFFANNEATFGNFKKNANNFSMLHLSTHANAGDTEFPASIKFTDQDILYSELYNLKINPDLVVLSACETGIGKLYQSEGAMSVARGFQFAGAKNLLFSLWKVNDYTTSEIMTNFYNNIKNGSSFIDANQKAKQDFLNNKLISNTKKSPYYWSAFIYYGTLETPSNNYYVYFTIAVIAIILGLLFYFRRRNGV